MRCRRSSHRDVLVVLAEFVRAGDHLALGDPLLEVLDLATEHVELEHLVQPTAPLLREVLQARVQLVHLRLLHRYLLTETPDSESFRLADSLSTCNCFTAICSLKHQTVRASGSRTACPPATASPLSAH